MSGSSDTRWAPVLGGAAVGLPWTRAQMEQLLSLKRRMDDGALSQADYDEQRNAIIAKL